MVKENGIDQEELSHILRLPSWTAEQAAQVLEAQRKSGLSQAQYAAQRGFSVGRLYNWKSKLRAKLRTAPKPADSETEAEKQMCSLSISFLGLELRIVRTPVAEHRV